MLGQIIDEHRDARLQFGEQRGDRLTLWPAIADDTMVEADLGQLGDAAVLMVGPDIGEDDDVGNPGQPVHRLDRAGNRCLAVHLVAEKAVEQWPDFGGFERGATGAAFQRVAEGRVFQLELYVMIVGQPGAERHDHVHQHFVTIADDQGTGHGLSCQSGRCGGQRGGGNVERIGTGDKIRLMIGEKLADRRENRRFGGPGAQLAGINAGQREEAMRAVIITANPRQRAEQQHGRIRVPGFPPRIWQHRCVTPNLFVSRLSLAYEARVGKGLGTLTAGQGAGLFMSSGKSVLVVEDNELNLRLFCDLLGAHGYSAEPVRDGRDVMARATAVRPHLIIMDIQLPHVSGMDLIAAVKADPLLSATPILAVTAYAGRDDEQRIRDAGAEAYISKPISVIRFIEAVSALI